MQLLPKLGPKLHENVLETLECLNIKVIMGQKPQLAPEGTAGKKTSTFEDDHQVGYDLLARPLIFSDEILTGAF
jgi:hypothetical protein